MKYYKEMMFEVNISKGDWVLDAGDWIKHQCEARILSTGRNTIPMDV